MKTIRQQLTRKLLLTLGLLICVGGFVIFLSARTALLTQFDAALRAKAQALTALVEQRGSRLTTEESVHDMRGYESGGSDFFELWQSEGKPLERSRSLSDAHLPLRFSTLDLPLVWNLILPDGQLGRAIGLKFRPRAEHGRRNDLPPIYAFVVVASDRRDLDHTLLTLQMVLVGGGVLLLVATVLVVPQVLRRELRPLQQLADGAENIDATSLSARFPSDGMPGELAPITARLNELMVRLEDSFERERRFSSDVAHEFRTPVAELRSMAELATKLPDARRADADHETLAIALQLESMLKCLLALARGEQGVLLVELKPVALVPLVQEVYDRLKPKAAVRQLVLSCRANVTADVDTDPALLRSILNNLLDNAVEYSPYGGTVEVEVVLADNQFTVRVANSVDNLDEHDLPHLFERFWRKDAVRSADGHTGLGLAVAQVFAKSIGCEITARFSRPKRLELTLAQVKQAIRDPETL